MKSDLEEEYLNKKIVIDHCVALSDVATHDNADTATSKEIYVFECL